MARAMNTDRVSDRKRRSKARGDTCPTASAMAAMCSGVVPQHPPTRLTGPSRANSPSSRDVTSGVSSEPVSLIGLGRPAFGQQLMTVSSAPRASFISRGASRLRPWRSSSRRPAGAHGAHGAHGARCAKRGHRLATEHTARGVGDRFAQDDGQALASLFKELVDRKGSRLGVERVEDGRSRPQAGAPGCPRANAPGAYRGP